MQTGVQRALPTAPLLSALLPGLFVAQSRTAVYTSNVMDETRTKRITDHFAYMKARKQYRLALHDVISKWRGEIRVQEAKERAEKRREEEAREREHAAELQQLTKEKAVASLAEQIRKAELEHKMAQLQLQRAYNQRSILQRRERRREARQKQLLEASRKWIRQEELEGAINAALDNPQPFGFVTTLPLRESI